VAQDEPEALLAYLAERLDTEETNVDAEAVRPEPGGARVRVLTVHKSKGLEFGIVFLPLAWWVLERDPADDFVVFHDDSDEACLDLGSESIGAHRMRAAREAEAERVRLAYVMLTRARHRTYAVIGKVRSGYRAGIAQVLFHPLDSSGYELLSADGYRAHLARRLGESPRGEGILHLDLPAPAAKPPHLASAEGAAAIESEPLLRAPPGPVPTWSYSALKQLGRQGEEGALPGRHDELADPDEFHGANSWRVWRSTQVLQGSRLPPWRHSPYATACRPRLARA
jgi:ATP-dependent exoDNAse (exonuclease V) beta subunit